MSVRKAHNSGRNHLRNVLEYYQQIGQEKAQSVIDSITSSYAAEGQAVPNPAMAPPGAYPPPFGLPGLYQHPLRHHIYIKSDTRTGQFAPPPFAMPPGPGGGPAMPPPPGGRGLPFPPPFPPTSGAPPPGGLPPLPNMPNLPNMGPPGSAPPPGQNFPAPQGGFPIPPPNFQGGAAPGFPTIPPPGQGPSGFSPSPGPGLAGPPPGQGPDGYAPPPRSLSGPPPGIGER
ncbi:putative U1 snRNP complex component Yhc1 [Aspergillus lucknowensis]|uniref:U1-C C2H2-type zinc finger domain-containing protein n=1 Tax=Aspergillus lucknowensis TaxID=176173 RepID=A0ABR4LE90_9EURO